jgi:uncharacterized protein YegL
MKKEGRALPVFLLVDVSGSMRGEKIETVNVALKEMLASFKSIEHPKGVIKLCIMAFHGDSVDVIKPLSEITEKDTYSFSADGGTPLGKAVEAVTDMIENKAVVASRDYTPTIVLISDGMPTDFGPYNPNITNSEIMSWEPLTKLNSSPRASKATRLAMGIGEDMDVRILRGFINNETVPLIKARDNDTISKFFQWVTMSISTRSVSANPNQATLEEPSMFGKDDIVF